MKLHVLLVAAATLLLAACSSGSQTSSFPQPNALTDIGAGVQGPSGLEAGVYSTGLTNVAALTFDAEGRLWAATAAFTDAGTDAVYVIASEGAAPLRVIDDAQTPLGLLWIDDTLYVSSREAVRAFEGFDGTHFAGMRTVIELPAGVGEVNGMALAPDGRISLGVSAPCDACDPESEYSAAVLSFLPDGSDLRVDANGIRAPIGLAYYPGTDDLFVTMNQRDALGDATPGDWLAVVEPGQDWRFPGCYGQGGTVCAGVPAPVAELDKHAAVSAVVIDPDGGLSDGSSAYVAEWASGKVLRVELSRSGGTYTSSVSTFLTGVGRPVGLALDADGSLFVGDWDSGTIYRITA